MSLRLLITTFCRILLVAAPGIAQTDPDTIPEAVLTEMIETGANLYNGGTCVICHAVGGRGSGRFAPALSDAEWLHSQGDLDGIFNTIYWGVPKEKIKAQTPRQFEMHPRGGMSIDRPQMMALAAYIWSLSYPDRSELVAMQAEFLEMLERGQIDEAVGLFQRQQRSDVLIFPERAINSLGYVYLRRQQQPEVAIEIFKLNVEAHPESWNTYDSLGEAYTVSGDTELAVRNYQKSLELNPITRAGARS